jgi:hypothetical protein
LTQSLCKIIPVKIIEENFPALNPSHNDMMQRTRSIYAGFSWHDSDVSDLFPGVTNIPMDVP